MEGTLPSPILSARGSLTLGQTMEDRNLTHKDIFGEMDVQGTAVWSRTSTTLHCRGGRMLTDFGYLQGTEVLAPGAFEGVTEGA